MLMISETDQSLCKEQENCTNHWLLIDVTVFLNCNIVVLSFLNTRFGCD